MWQAEAETELTLSASPATAVGQKALALAKRRYSTVHITSSPITQQSHKQLHIATFPVVKMKLFTYVGLLFPVIVTEDKKIRGNMGVEVKPA